jgi:hypothetical protein
MERRRPGGREDGTSAIDDYRVVIAALETELGRYFVKLRGGPHLRDRSS